MTAAGRPTVPHPDVDTLADLDAGVLDPAAAEDVAAHVGGCARCASVLASFDTVRADLLALPAPRMPAPVAARMDAVLADLRREATGQGTARAPQGQQPQGQQPQGQPPQGQPPQGQPPPRPVADLGKARERKRRSVKLGTGAVAAAFVLIAAGASVTALVTNAGKQAGEGGTAAAGSVNDEAAAPQPSGTKLPPGLEPTIPAYTKQTLQSSLSTITRESAVTDITRLGETGPGGVMANQARRQACERSITEATGLLTAVRRIQYNGDQAYVFVFRETGGRVNAWVVDTSCGSTGALPANVLDSVS